MLESEQGSEYAHILPNQVFPQAVSWGAEAHFHVFVWSPTLIMPSMETEMTSDETALTLAATREHPWPDSRHMTWETFTNMHGMVFNKETSR